MIDLRKVLEKTHSVTVISDQDLLKTDFSHPGKIHDWRNYVDRQFIDVWSELTPNERLILWSNGEKLSDMEEWD